MKKLLSVILVLSMLFAIAPGTISEELQIDLSEVYLSEPEDMDTLLMDDDLMLGDVKIEIPEQETELASEEEILEIQEEAEGQQVVELEEQPDESPVKDGEPREVSAEVMEEQEEAKQPHANDSCKLALSASSWKPSASGGTKTVTVSGVSGFKCLYSFAGITAEEKAVYDYKWLTIKKSGKKLKLKARKNFAASSRKAVVMVYCEDHEDVYKKITITQKASTEKAPTLSVTVSPAEVNAGDSVKVTVKYSNTRRLFLDTAGATDSNPAAKTVSYSSKEKTGTYTLKIPDDKVGSYEMKIYASNSNIANDFWTQRNTAVETLTVITGGCKLGLSTTDWKPSASGGSKTVTVSGVDSYKVAYSYAGITAEEKKNHDYNWLTIKKNGNKLTLKARKNFSASTRKAAVIVTCGEHGDISKQITITQAASTEKTPTLTVTVSPNPVVAGSSVKVTVQYTNARRLFLDTAGALDTNPAAKTVTYSSTKKTATYTLNIPENRDGTYTMRVYASNSNITNDLWAQKATIEKTLKVIPDSDPAPIGKPEYVAIDPCDIVAYGTQLISYDQDGSDNDQTNYPLDAGKTYSIAYSTGKNVLGVKYTLCYMDGDGYWRQYGNLTAYRNYSDYTIGHTDTFDISLPSDMNGGVYLLRIYAKNAVIDDSITTPGDYVCVKATIYVKGHNISYRTISYIYNQKEYTNYWMPNDYPVYPDKSKQDTSSSRTLASSGCGIFTIAHAIQWLTGTVPNIATVRDYCGNTANYSKGMCGSAMKYLGDAYGIKNEAAKATDAYIKGVFNKGGVIVAATSGTGDHYFLAVEYIEYNSNTYVHIIDSSTGSTLTRGYQGYWIDTLEPINSYKSICTSGYYGEGHQYWITIDQLKAKVLLALSK